MRRVCMVVAALLAISGCCDKGTKRIQPHWLRSYEGYQLYLVELRRPDVNIPFSSIVDQRGTCFVDQPVVGCLATERYGFWLDVTNKSMKPIRLLWPEARYVDEKSVGHELFRQPMGALPSPSEMKISQPVSVSAGDRIHDVVAPIYKSYLVASGCKDLIPYREPLIPTRLDDKNEQQMKAYVDDLAKRHVPVKLLLPIEVDGVRYDYTFAFELRDRWADLPKE